MSRFPRTTAAFAAIGTTLTAVVIAGAVVAGSATANPLGDAQQRAAALSKAVNRLQTQAEVVTERYDATEAALNLAVAQRGQADQALAAEQATAATAQQNVVARARALYETGGEPTIVASLLSGQDPLQALDQYRMADSVIGYESRSAQSAAAAVVRGQAIDQRAAAASKRITTLQVQRSSEASRVRSLLAEQQHALQAANATVKRIMRANAAAAAAAAARDFAGAVAAAGGTLNVHGSMTPPNAIAAAAIAAARSRLGVPYVWGATGPDAFDCSGLTQWSYAHAGINLPRTAAEQWYSGPHPSLAQLEPGDLLFWALNTSDPATIHHVTIYIGDGLMIAAPHTGTNVQIQPVYTAGLIGATRPWVGHTGGS
jgi:cell wall-associated NlpC family hydrolase